MHFQFLTDFVCLLFFLLQIFFAEQKEEKKTFYDKKKKARIIKYTQSTVKDVYKEKR